MYGENSMFKNISANQSAKEAKPSFGLRVDKNLTERIVANGFKSVPAHVNITSLKELSRKNSDVHIDLFKSSAGHFQYLIEKKPTLAVRIYDRIRSQFDYYAQRGRLTLNNFSNKQNEAAALNDAVALHRNAVKIEGDLPKNVNVHTLHSENLVKLSNHINSIIKTAKEFPKKSFSIILKDENNLYLSVNKNKRGVGEQKIVPVNVRVSFTDDIGFKMREAAKHFIKKSVKINS